MNEFDQFVKHKLHIKYYVRYTDDFIIVGENKEYLENLLPPINNFLKEKLSLKIHSKKFTIRKFSQGIDFLGYVVLPYYRVLRTKTKRRIFRKVLKRKSELELGIISRESFEQSLQSYFGVLGHCQGYKIKKEILGML